jgi:hypothetical protein
MQELNNNETIHLLKRFPKIELSYETMSHKKIQPEYNFGIHIPVGKKCFIWYTFYQDKDVYFILYLNKEKQVVKAKWYINDAENSLSIGTILYGTWQEPTADVMPVCGENSQSNVSGSLINSHKIGGVNDKKCKIPTILVEDIFYYNGICLKNVVFSEKLGFIYDFLQKNKKTELMNILLPKIWFRENDDMFIDNTDYIIHHVQYRCLTKMMPHLNIKLTLNIVQTSKSIETAKNNILIPQKRDVSDQPRDLTFIKYNFNKQQYKYPTVFHVSADLQYDIYHLFAFGKNNSPVYYNLAYIPNYKISVYMNGLFRNIRENKNLDYIEESDDESDFENMKEDKYVDLNKVLIMECVFHTKFKKWVPVKVCKKGERVIHISQLL